MAEILPIEPAKLLIDEENPRISDPNEGQNKALQSLAQFLGPKLQALAAHIIANGINPADLPIVMALTDQSGRYTVLEGNRRLAAIRSLENPESINGAAPASVLTQIRRLSKTYLENPIETINCVLVRDREEARPWIELRHTGENGGAGVVPWGSIESSRYGARQRVAMIHMQALEFLETRGDLPAETRKKLPATSFRRLLESPAVRAKVGVEVQDRVLHMLADPGRVAKALMYLVDDLASGRTNVRKIYTKEQREEYARKLPSEIVVKPIAKSGHGVPVSATSAAAAREGSKKKPRSSKQRDRLIPSHCVMSIPPGRVSDIETELRRRLSLENHTNAASVLFRVFIELSVDSYLEDYPANGITEDSALQKKMAAVAADLVARGKLTEKQRTPVSRACQKDSFLAPSITLMHNYVHNPHVFPAPGDLRAHWDSLQPFLAAIWTE